MAVTWRDLTGIAIGARVAVDIRSGCTVAALPSYWPAASWAAIKTVSEHVPDHGQIAV
jgi:hypothetical protein